ncbi:TetR/AcrR family transcriptional regulator [Gordonia sp. CPCC 205515]|uniref:TetR/AcrR family transcriptional regulator n=1 Tax=Gordonia sp. CPCC 205515 TaxID=3140791 RepID=UPI003AF3517D
MVTAEIDATPRRTRPKDRKWQILATAADMFRTHGYAEVGMSDIAATVGIVPSALYRHYRSKQDLLAAVLDDALDSYARALADVADPAEVGERLAGATLESRAFDLIWTRDRGHLSCAEYNALVQRVRVLAARVSELISMKCADGGMPSDTIAWAVMSVMEWPSHRELEVITGEQVPLLSAVADSIVRQGCAPDQPPPPSGSATAPTPLEPDAGLLPASRREALLNTAITLFATRGYPNVSLDDIGEVVGIAGPSVYNHFGSKREILVTGLTRAFEVLWLDVGQALRQTTDPAEALDALIVRHARFAFDHWDLATVCLSHFTLLDEQAQQVLGRSYIEYVAEYRRLLMSCRPELRPDQAQSLVDLALAVNTGLVRVPGIRDDTLPHYSGQLARAVLFTPLTSAR